MTFNSFDSPSPRPHKNNFSRSSITGFIIVVVVTLIIGFFVGRLSVSPKHPTQAQVTVTTTVKAKSPASRTKKTSASIAEGSTQTIPANVAATLQKIDERQWPPHDHSRTHGGTSFHNNEGVLPKTDDTGNPIEYTEWDVNITPAYHQRDAQRIITGSDHSAYYTLDHYKTFTKIR